MQNTENAKYPPKIALSALITCLFLICLYQDITFWVTHLNLTMSADYHENECEDDGKVSSDVIRSVSEDYKNATGEQEKKRYISCFFVQEIHF